ncbi:MAG: S-layer homology domain-containing protein, partial [Clostridiales bacterium]|nr:S-layer homology domain-containing protein [Clostridiales bacterium]
LYAKLVKTSSEDETETDKEETEETEEETGETYYSDIAAEDWFYDAVEYVRQKGLMVGISEDEFAPDLPLTRGMFVTVLYRIEGTPEVSEEASFKDVFEGDWYYEAVKWGDKNDIIFGYSAEEYAPNDRITREQMAAIIYRYAAYKGINTDTEGSPDYTDSGSISGYAVPGVKWVSDKGFMQGDPDGAFRPTDNASRAETAQVIMNVVENLAKV